MGRREGRRALAGLRDEWWPFDPARLVGFVQPAKAALAGTLAWVLASSVLGLEQPFLAPWSAVLVVHATVYRTVSRGAQQVAATFVGVLLAWTAGQLLGLGAAAMALMLVVAFGLAGLRWWREEATTIATTGIAVLATNAVAHTNLLTGRLVDTAIGVVVGLAVNLLVWPPLRDRAAWSRIDELPEDLADVLEHLASGLSPELEPEQAEEWTRQLREVDTRVDEAWGLVRQAQESSRLNPRRSRPAGLDEMDGVLHRIEQAVADVQSMVRTVVVSARNDTVWDAGFRSDWARLVTRTAGAVRRLDDAALLELPGELGVLVSRLSDDALARSAWHEYGGLLVNLRNVVDALAEVTSWANRSGPSTRRQRRYRLPPLGHGYPVRHDR
jgi:hypothetical protein